jgi:hypothetical protein
MIDAVHLIAGMQPIPRGSFVSVDNGPRRHMRADGRDCCGFARGDRRVRVATALPSYNNGLALACLLLGQPGGPCVRPSQCFPCFCHRSRSRHLDGAGFAAWCEGHSRTRFIRHQAGWEYARRLEALTDLWAAAASPRQGWLIHNLKRTGEVGEIYRVLPNDAGRIRSTARSAI